MKKVSRLLVPVLAVLTCILPALGQAVTGTPPFSTIGGGSLDQIDLANLNTHFCIPIVNKTGRGTPFTYSLCYDSSLWTPYGSQGCDLPPNSARVRLRHPG